MIGMICPNNKNVKDNTGCQRCFSHTKQRLTRALCVVDSKAKYITEGETDGGEIRENNKPDRGKRKRNKRSASASKRAA